MGIDLTRAIAEGAEKSISDDFSDIHAQRIHALDLQKVQAAERIAQLRDDERRALGAIENLRAECDRVISEKSDLEEEEDAGVPIMKYALSLYALISNIVWDYNSQNVKGIMTSPDGDLTKPFDIDPSQITSFNLTNDLWEMMD